jgi:single-stranded DNA-specific DHH superfamily exonuclease
MSYSTLHIYEQRLANNKKDFHQIWNNIFSNTPTVNTKFITGTRNRRNATKEMVSKRPRLQPISKKKQQQKTN